MGDGDDRGDGGESGEKREPKNGSKFTQSLTVRAVWNYTDIFIFDFSSFPPLFIRFLQVSPTSPRSYVTKPCKFSAQNNLCQTNIYWCLIRVNLCPHRVIQLVVNWMLWKWCLISIFFLLASFCSFATLQELWQRSPIGVLILLPIKDWIPHFIKLSHTDDLKLRSNCE